MEFGELTLDVMEALRAIQAYQSGETERRVIRWLSPPDKEPIYYKDRYMELILARCEGTGKWILHEAAFELWKLPETPEHLLWIHGDPGFGKSVIAASVVEHLRHCDPRDATVLYFFLDARSNNSIDTTHPSAVLRSLVYQLTISPYTLSNNVVQNAVKRSTQKRASRFDDLWKLFVALLCLTKLTYIVIDALDECTDHQLLIRQFLNLVSTSDCRVKILFTSRATGYPEICDRLEDFSSILVSASKTEKDMNNFVDFETSKLTSIKRPMSSSIVSQINKKLKSSADGMYLILTEQKKIDS